MERQSTRFVPLVLTLGLGVAVLVGCDGQQPPVADPGPALTGRVGEPVSLDGSASRDPAGHPLTYRWRFASLPPGSQAQLAQAETATAWFVPDVPGSYELLLQVDNGQRRSAPARLLVEVACAVRLGVTAEVVGAAEGPAGVPVQLRGAAQVLEPPAGCPAGTSGEPVFLWTFTALPAGSQARLTDPTSPTPQFTPDRPGEYRLTLQVQVLPDGEGRAEASYLAVCGAAPPVISALSRFPAGELRPGERIRLDAVVEDPDARAGCDLPQPLTYAWSLRSLPAGSASRVEGEPTAALARITPDREGEYRVGLAVTDPQGNVGAAELAFTVSGCGVSPPVIRGLVADPSAPAVGTAVSLRADVVDADGEPPCALAEALAYTWALRAVPRGSQARITPSTAAQPSLIVDRPGNYTISLDVVDIRGLRATAELALEAATCGAGVPTVQLAAEPAAPSAGSRIVVSARVTDPDDLAPCSLAEPQTVRWSFREVPGGFAPPALPMRERVDFVATLPGIYRLQALAVDARGHASSPGELALFVAPCGSAPPRVGELVAVPSPATVGEAVRLAVPAEDPDVLAGCAPPTPLAHDWRFTALPAGSEAELLVPRGPTPSFVPDRPGRYGLAVTVTAGTGRQGLTQGEVVVAACGAAVPVVTAHALPEMPATGDLVRLEAEVVDADTQEPCGLTESHTLSWAVLDVPAGYPPAGLRLDLLRPTVAATLSGTYRFQVTAVDRTGQRSLPAEVSFTVAPCGAAPPVVARIEQTPVQPAVGEVVQFAAVAQDPDAAPDCGRGTDLTYHFGLIARPAGSVASLLGADTASPSLVPDVAGDYRLRLVVIDGTGRASAPAEHLLIVSRCGDGPPVIEELLASPLLPRVGEPVRLTARVSDPDEAAGCGRAETWHYDWALIEAPRGSRAELSNPAGQAAGLTPDLAGRFRVRLQVSDAAGHRALPRELLLEVADCGGFAPEISALFTEPAVPVVDQPLRLGATTRDRDVAECGLAQTLAHRWTLVALPAGSRATLLEAPGPSPSLIPDRPGEYGVRLQLVDSTGLPSPVRELTIAVPACGGAHPELNLGLADPGQALRVGVPVQVQAVVSDLDEQPPCLMAPDYTYLWSLIDQPAGSQARLEATSGPAPFLVPDRRGSYRIAGVVTDASGRASLPALLSLTVSDPCGDGTPVVTRVTATPAAGVPVGTVVQLDAVYADDDDLPACALDQALLPTWRFLERPVGSRAELNDPHLAASSFLVDVAGGYRLTFQVADGTGRVSDPAFVEVQAIACGGLPPVARVQRLAPPPVAELQSTIPTRALACVGAPFLQLDAAPSADPDNEVCAANQHLDFAWTVLETPAGGSLGILRPASRNPSLVVDAGGRYVVDLHVDDSTGRTSDPFHVTLDVEEVPAPVLQDVSPSLFCPEEPLLEVPGSNLFRVGGALPTLLFGDRELPADSLTGCVPYDQTFDVQRCTTLRATVPAGFPADVYDLRVVNPFPVGCVSANSLTVVVAGAPSIESVEPDPICRGEFDGWLTLRGSGFFFREGIFDDEPEVWINGQQVAIADEDDCTRVGFNLWTCDTIRFRVPLAMRDDDLEIRIENPPPADCETAVFVLQQHDPPRLDDVQPRKICHLGGSLVLTGAFFEPGMSVRLGLDFADPVVINAAGTVATATWSHELPPGLFRLTATNASGCATEYANEIRVTEGPFVFFVDPPTVYNGISLQATVFLGNLYGGSITRVILTSPGGVAIPVTHSFDPLRPNRVSVFLPEGLTPGLYDVTVEDDVGCPGTTEDLFRVVDRLTVGLGRVDPPFGWQATATAVTLTTKDPLPAGETLFAPTPRVYISLTDAGPADQAAELRGVVFQNPTTLQAVVDQGLPVGSYDLIVVNPDGGVGLLSGRFQVTAQAPPVVDGVSPGSWEMNDAALPVVVTGTGFDAQQVGVECQDRSGVIVTPAVTLVDQTATRLDIRVDTTTIPQLSSCILRVTNRDTSYGDYSPITVTNPSGKFVDFFAGTNLATARRAPAVFAAVPSRTARFLYALGGDPGDGVAAFTSGEVAPLDRFGHLEAWRPLPDDLPRGLTLTRAVRLDDFVYLPGGYLGGAGGGATNQVLRALVLDPLDTPRISAVDFTFDREIVGLLPGVYYYRVAATFPADHPSNPGGEGLASDPQPVYIPPRLTVGLRAVLEWTAQPGAATYKIYRSVEPDKAYGNERLLAELPADGPRTWTDEGTTVPAGDQPLPVAALGKWHTFAQLQTARYNHGVAAARDPADPTRYHLYAVGGESGAAVLDSYEVVSVDVRGPRDQRLAGPVQQVAGALAIPRTELQAVAISVLNASSIVNGKSYLYALSGLTTNRKTSRAVEAAEVLAGGLLAAFVMRQDVNPFSSGYAAAAANNAMIVAGGQQSQPDNKGSLTTIDGGRDDPPFLENWSSLASLSMAPRYLMGSTVFGGFFYLVGGLTTGDVAAASTDLSVLGGTP